MHLCVHVHVHVYYSTQNSFCKTPSLPLSLSLSLSLSPALFIRCTKCNNYDGPLETPSVINEKGASVMAAYSNVDSKFVRVLY